MGQRRRALAERRGSGEAGGEARPAWKILRVLGNLLGFAGFEYVSSEEVRDELRRELDSYVGGVTAAAAFAAGRLAAMDVTREVTIYGVDAIVRRSAPLQATIDGRKGGAGGGGA